VGYRPFGIWILAGYGPELRDLCQAAWAGGPYLPEKYGSAAAQPTHNGLAQ
jgi:hypothetical protein